MLLKRKVKTSFSSINFNVLFSCMTEPQYELFSDESSANFEFISIGNKGEISKIVVFSEVDNNFYHLGFGDKNEETGEISDLIVSNNGDSEKVLATVAACILIFTSKFPNAYVYATGSTESRTRLYRIGITNNLDEILQDFEVFGEIIGQQGAFQEFKKGVKYSGFLVKRREGIL
jgi:hypothetical protein